MPILHTMHFDMLDNANYAYNAIYAIHTMPFLILTQGSSWWEEKGTHLALLHNWHCKWHCLVVNYAALLTKYKKVHDHWPKIKSDKVELPRIPMNSLLHPFHLFMSVFMYHLCNCIMTDLFNLYSAFLHDLQHKFKNICVFLEGSYKIQKIVEYFKTLQELRMLSPSLFIQGSQCKC